MSTLKLYTGLPDNTKHVYVRASDVFSNRTILQETTEESTTVLNLSGLDKPTLIMRWTVGGSWNFDIGIKTYYDHQGVQVCDKSLLVRTGLTTSGEFGLYAPLTPIDSVNGKLSELSLFAIRILYINRDMARPSPGVYAFIVGRARNDIK